MADLSILAGATSQSILVDLYILSTGAAQTGLAFNSSGLTAYYSFVGTNATSTAITLATLAAVNSAYSSGGFKEIDATNMPGIYRLDLPNAAIAASKGREVIVTVNGFAGMATRHIKIELTAVDNQSTGFGLVNVSSNVVQWNGSAVSTPATAGIPDINVKNMNNVAATSITTINANQGTTQPLNFTGTAGSALVKSDMVDIAGAAVSASTAQIGVNVVNIAGSASAGVAGYVGVDWSHVNAPTTAVGLTNTTISTTQAVASVSGAVGSVTGAVGSVTGAVGSVTGNVGGNVVGTVASVTGAVGSVTGNVGGSVASVTGAVGSVTGNVGGSVASVTGSVGSVTGLTTATIATAVWTDTTAGDFTTTSSPGRILVSQLGGAFTTTSSSVYSIASLANAPSGGGSLTAAQVATAVWQDLTSSSDFTTANSIGKLFTTAIPNAAPGASGGFFIAGSNAATTVNFTGNLSGSVGSVTGAVGSVTSGVTVTTNNDKTGYTLTQTFPANFSSLAVNGSGQVRVD